MCLLPDALCFIDGGKVAVLAALFFVSQSFFPEQPVDEGPDRAGVPGDFVFQRPILIAVTLPRPTTPPASPATRIRYPAVFSWIIQQLHPLLHNHTP
jgi:hypothetical protein